jgi:hypothetical protein
LPQHEEIPFSLYPNPVLNGSLTLVIETKKKEYTYKLKVYDTMGQKLKAQNVQTGKSLVSLQGLTPGMYFVSLKGKSCTKEVFKKLMIL